MLIARRVFAVFTLLVCLAGLVVSLFLAAQIWQARQPVLAAMQNSLEGQKALLNTSDQALVQAESTLKVLQGNLDALEAATLTLAQTAHDTGPMLESLTTLTDETLPQTLDSTQKSLVTAQTSALAVEVVLGAVTQIPFFPGGPYQPETPLNVALGQIANSLALMRPQLNELQTSLSKTQADLNALESDLVQIAVQIGYLQAELELVSPILKDYRLEISRILEDLDLLQNSLPGWVNGLAALLLFLLGWMGVFQVYLAAQAVWWLLPQKTTEAPG